jgi:hypothetical protein
MDMDIVYFEGSEYLLHLGLVRISVWLRTNVL